MNTYIKDYTNTFIIHSHEYEVTSPAKFDQETNEVVSDTKLDDQAVEIANSLYREEFGLISPQDIKKYRAKIGLSQREFAKLTGLSPNTVALYETGAFPTKANNKLLKLLFSDDNLLEELVQQNKRTLSDVIIKKTNNYLQSKEELITNTSVKPKFNSVQLTNWYRVTNYFAAQADENVEHLTQMKVLKLLYFAYGRYGARSASNLFLSPILALAYGPVVKEVHEKFNGQKDLIANGLNDKAFADFSEIAKDAEITGILNEILQDYGNQTAYSLSKITHQLGSPWSLTEKGKIINPNSIIETFSRGIEW
ncbi:DUF4065 domain-containing protein [Lactobacillus sp. ESL0679]|uniref:type II TA system antitoxin MqsA family protein n=1 Tax=Lactobacillus sp. ESL0679 TaxID=2983209 RepID=UPI0023F6560E|nr:type II TA system antitoxin MqsA family protein [Lactobacillus sp. ESL0679]MDF7683734.1 DUF4065 domain-containing protein [Lactobacillus sp. ESL0679]